MKNEIKAYKKAFALMSITLVIWAASWFVKADGTEFVGRVGFLLLATAFGAFWVVGKYGSVRAREWVERSF